MPKTIKTPNAPAAVGPYSQARVSGSQVWCAGQIPLDPRSGEMVEGGIEAQTRQALDNLEAVLKAAGSGLDQILRTTVYLVEMADFQAMNGVYAEFFRDSPPARVCVEVSRLPRDARVEIDAVAELS